MSRFSHESIYEEACRKGELPGAVLVAADATGKFQYAKAFGETAYGEKLSADSVMWIASCTKLMTSVAALQQVDRGNIGLDEDLSRVLPELAALEVLEGFNSEDKPILKKREGVITLRLLLSHASGLGYEILDPNLQRFAASDTPSAKPPRTIVSEISRPLVYHPGRGWAYSTGIDWAGQLVERLSGLRLEQYMRVNIWEPLGMWHMSFDPDSSPELKKRKVGMSLRNEAGQLIPTTEGYYYQYSERDGAYGGSSAWGSAESYLKLLQTLCANDGRVLSRDLVDEMFRPQLGPEGKAILNHQLKTYDVPKRVFANSFDVETQDFDYGLGGAIGLKDVVGRRAAGTMSWGGLPNLIWWIDRREGLCGACFTQLLPMGDVNANNLEALFEKAIYERYEEFLREI
ncbi:hypothetical protein DL770_003237 [Monosporascus sp. CRB-9-2]|nr:hypothetical protein DL770_003237 [Monosporascus sp. CRB-9-2]